MSRVMIEYGPYINIVHIDHIIRLCILKLENYKTLHDIKPIILSTIFLYYQSEI